MEKKFRIHETLRNPDLLYNREFRCREGLGYIDRVILAIVEIEIGSVRFDEFRFIDSCNLEIGIGDIGGARRSGYPRSRSFLGVGGNPYWSRYGTKIVFHHDRSATVESSIIRMGFIIVFDEILHHAFHIVATIERLEFKIRCEGLRGRINAIEALRDPFPDTGIVRRLRIDPAIYGVGIAPV